jgi:hypothetical protein
MLKGTAFSTGTFLYRRTRQLSCFSPPPGKSAEQCICLFQCFPRLRDGHTAGRDPFAVDDMRGLHFLKKQIAVLVDRVTDADKFTRLDVG